MTRAARARVTWIPARIPRKPYLMNRMMTIAARARVTRIPARMPRKGVNSTTTEDSES